MAGAMKSDVGIVQDMREQDEQKFKMRTACAPPAAHPPPTDPPAETPAEILALATRPDCVCVCGLRQTPWETPRPLATSTIHSTRRA